MGAKKRSQTEQHSFLSEPAPTPGSVGQAEGGSDRRESDDRLKIHKTIRLAVTGDVLLTRLETEVVDTASFQRLRRVRQLGSAYHVYPTALHTRFDHALGTLAVADRMIKAIRNNSHSLKREKEISEEQELLTRLYALLHDVTHIPFGHTFEDELGLFTRHDKNASRIDRFLGDESEIGKLIIRYLDRNLYDRLLAIYRWDGQDDTVGDDAFIYDLVSNTVCADLIDYVVRDSFFCGLSHTLDFRFLNFLYLGDYANTRRVFVRLWKDSKPMPRRDTLTDLATLLQERYLVAERIYFHHAKVNSAVMVARALQEAMLAGKVTEETLYEHSDDTLLQLISSLEGTVAARLGQGVLDRHLHKLLEKYTEADFSGIQDHDHRQNAVDVALKKVSDATGRRWLENRLADEAGGRPGDVLIYAPERGMNRKVAEMRVLWKGKPSTLDQIDDDAIKPKLDLILGSPQHGVGRGRAGWSWMPPQVRKSMAMRASAEWKP